MNPEIEATLRSLVSFPSPPGIATHIIQLARDPDITMSKVARLLSMDSALASKILRVANSPLYAQRRKTDNLRQALVVLGLNATLSLALSFTLVKSLRAGKANGLSYPLYWRRALLAATAARALADVMHHSLAEEIFLAALLQDVGMMALDRAVPDLYRGGEALQRDHTALAAFELRRLQTDHADIGGVLMKMWDLPDRLHRAIRQSHRIDLSPTNDPALIFERCVALSGPVADLFLLDPEHREFAQIGQSALQSIGLDKLAFGQVLGTVGAMIPEMEAIFECDSLAAQNPELILEQAREVLMLRSLHALRDMNMARAQEEARRDSMTGVYNRAYVDRALAREFDDTNRNRWPLSVAFVDLDEFKSINDRFGQQAGDRILQTAARILRSNARASDLIARYTGEKFVLVFPATDAETARSVCESIVVAFRNTGHVIGSERAKVTISIGSATHSAATPFTSAADLVMAAEQALRAAKLGGRNRLVPFDRQMRAKAAASA